ncbi:hypothetical protein K4K58_012202 [Colletotrichum sp. SAR11_239]|nr:hypothetical protein K4K58_012202 [Colletotrichum sp. SAR11_239]
MPGQDEYLKLQNKLDQKEREMKALQEQFHEERAWLTNKLQEAREISRMLQQEVDKQGQSIDNLRKHAMAQLASDNSSSFPDDAVERSFRQFFNNEDFEGWIDENKAAQIKDAKTTIQTLQQSNVMGESNLKVGLHLKTEAFIEWRIHTYKVLGLKYDRKPEIFQAYALEFCKANSGILGPLTKEALDELSGFYKEFANLAQKLWMLKTCITVEGLEQHSLHKFSDSGMRAHDLIRNGPDASAGKLNGRPIWALVRPRIVSWPLRNKDGRGIVWSQAVVWV